MSAAVQDHYPDDFAHCYGCGRLNDHGLKVRSVPEGDETVARITPRAEHVAMPGFVYGGHIASLIDCHGIGNASALAVRESGHAIGEVPSPRYVTAALKVEFLKPTPIGGELVLRAHVIERGKRKITSAVSLLADGVETARGEVIAAPLPESMGKPGGA